LKILAIIPARGGSKGLPMKNIKKMAGIPLIKHTILAAKKAKVFDKIIVSTDNEKILEIAKKEGLEIPFLRPKRISKDKSSTVDAIKHTIDFLEKESYVPEIIVVLQPTSPLRKIQEIKKAVNLLKKSNATSVISVTKIKTHPYSSFWHNTKYLKPFKENFEKFTLRQDKPSLYYPTGSIYAFKLKTLKKYDSVYGPRIKPMINKFEEDITDIDSLYDFFLAEQTLLNWKKYQKKLKD
jgi:CMP-N,N'-diacetyllegionaminic acid synthase